MTEILNNLNDVIESNYVGEGVPPRITPELVREIYHKLAREDRISRPPINLKDYLSDLSRSVDENLCNQIVGAVLIAQPRTESEIWGTFKSLSIISTTSVIYRCQLSYEIGAMLVKIKHINDIDNFEGRTNISWAAYYKKFSTEYGIGITKQQESGLRLFYNGVGEYRKLLLCGKTYNALKATLSQFNIAITEHPEFKRKFV